MSVRAGVAIVFALLILGEAAMRAVLALAQFDPPIYQATTSVTRYGLIAQWHGWVRIAGRTTEVTINQGTRVVPGQQAVSERARRVHLIGDSQVFGWGLHDEETIAAQLQRALGPTYRVINHGVPGWGPDAYVEVISRLDPRDVIIVVHSETNDISDLFDRERVHVDCARLRVQTFQWPCALRELSLVQGLAAARKGWQEPKRALPITFDTDSRTAASILQYRLHSRYERLDERLRGRLLFTYVPWDAAIERERRGRYWPSHAIAELRTAGLPDNCNVAEAFTNVREAHLFLSNDEHLSAEGAALMASLLQRCIRRIV